MNISTCKQRHWGNICQQTGELWLLADSRPVSVSLKMQKYWKQTRKHIFLCHVRQVDYRATCLFPPCHPHLRLPPFPAGWGPSPAAEHRGCSHHCPAQSLSPAPPAHMGHSWACQRGLLQQSPKRMVLPAQPALPLQTEVSNFSAIFNEGKTLGSEASQFACCYNEVAGLRKLNSIRDRFFILMGVWSCLWDLIQSLLARVQQATVN